MNRNPYSASLIEWLNQYETNLLNNLDRVPLLTKFDSLQILRKFLGLACQAQNDANIRLGRYGIWSLPKPWTIANIQPVVEQMLDLNDEWEYRRLLEVYEKLDESLLKQLVEFGLQSENAEIQEAASDFQPEN